MLWATLLGLAVTSPASLPVRPLTIDGHRFEVEVATTDAQRSMGLMHRDQLASDRGMWFVFDEEKPLSFWMENTLIPLDILYFDHGHRLVAQQLNVPPCTAAPCPLYPSDVPAQYVLEVPAGTAHRLGMGIGDTANIAFNQGATP